MTQPSPSMDPLPHLFTLVMQVCKWLISSCVLVIAADGHRLGHAGLGDVARTLDAVGLQGDLLAGPLRAGGGSHLPPTAMARSASSSQFPTRLPPVISAAAAATSPADTAD